MIQENVAYTHNEILPSLKKGNSAICQYGWTLRTFTLSETRQPGKDKYHMILLMRYLK